MKKLSFLLITALLLLTLSDSAPAGTAEIKATQGKATDARYPDAVQSEARLATRNGTWPDAKKSWLQFDLSDLYDANPLLQGNITNAKLMFYGAKTETSNKTYVVSGLNDSANLESWTAATLTWNNAPANDASSGTGLGAGLTTLLYTGTVLPPCEGVLSETPEADQAALTAFLNTDTDGLITFAFAAGGTTYLYNAGADLEPVLVVEGNITAGQVCSGVGTPYIAYANASSRCEGATYADSNRSDSSKLSVRASANGVKSWIKFDIGSLDIDPNLIRTATLRVSLHVGKGGSQTCGVSAVNDNYRTNIGWGETDITWANAPGNDTSSVSALVPSQTSLVGTIAFTDGVAGQQFYVDVLPAIQADSDGILQFVLHNSANLLDFATHDHPLGAEYWPRLDILEGPAGADNPYPCPDQIVSSDLAGLTWTNPEPNEPTDVTCTVYLGTEPNRLQMNSVTLSPNAHSVLINSTNFGTYGNLQNLETYYWIVDCYDEGTSTLIPGLTWSFYVNNNEAPVVDAGAEQVLWGLPKTVTLNGDVTDDGLPLPAALTYLWEQVANDAPAAAPSPDNTVDTSVVITEAGDYEFRLTTNDGQASTSDTVRVVVGSDSCDASHLSTGAGYAPGDANEDCIVDLDDFVTLIAKDWMECTDTQTNCQ